MSTNQPETSERERGPRILRAMLVGALACGALVAAAAHAQKPTVGITGGLESGTTLVTLPATPSGSFLARECRDCPSIRVSFDANTRYVIGDQAVSYAKFREAAAKGDIRLYVSYRLADKTLTRLRLAAPGN
jgi:hypothetical protein